TVVGHYAPTDPVAPADFDRPGGFNTQPSTTTYNYDRNGNLIETVDAEDTDGDPSNNSTIAAFADVTRTPSPAQRRRKTVTDPLGNRTTYVYDPDSNVVRVIQDGEPVNDALRAGTVTGAGPDTLQDTAKNWKADQWVGRAVRLTVRPGEEE